MKSPRSRKETMRKEYDFSGGVRGKYAAKFAKGSNVVILEPDVAKLFPDSFSVNKALRAIASAIPQKRKLTGTNGS